MPSARRFNLTDRHVRRNLLSGGGVAPGPETEQEHDRGKSDMQPNVRHVVRDQSKDGLVLVVEPEHSYERVDDSKDFEKRARRSGTSHSAEEKDDSGCKMDKVVGEVDVEGAEQHLVAGCGRDEPENSDKQKNDTKKNCGCFEPLLPPIG